MKRLSEDIKKPWLKATLKYIKNLIKNQIFLAYDSEKGDPVNPCMDVCKSKIKSDGRLDKLKLIIVLSGDLHNKDLIEYTWSSTASVRNLKHFLADYVKNKARVHQLDLLENSYRQKLRIGYL